MTAVSEFCHPYPSPAPSHLFLCINDILCYYTGFFNIFLVAIVKQHTIMQATAFRRKRYETVKNIYFCYFLNVLYTKNHWYFGRIYCN